MSRIRTVDANPKGGKSLGPLPEWDLSDLYPGEESAEIKRDMDWLEAACADTGRSRGEIVRDALRRQLSLIRFVQLRRQALPFGEAAGWFSDGDVFREIS